MRLESARLLASVVAKPRIAGPGTYVALIVVTVTLTTLLVRGNYSFTSGRYLWAEDGYIFFNHARTGGFWTVTRPYAGYLHVLPRLVAWLSSGLPLSFQPLVYSGVWVAALIVMVATIATRGRAMGMDATTVCGLVFLCAFQPAAGEMFFNLTNAQWLLGAALTLQMLTRDEWPGPSRQLVALILLCLTGPFCLVILPMVAAVHIGRRPAARTLVALGCFVACAAVQVFFLLTTDRVAGRGEHIDPWLLMVSIVQIFLFLPGRLLDWITSIGFWLMYASLLVSAIARRETRWTMHTRIIVLLLAAAVAFLAASMLSGAFPPRTARNGFIRYTWIPYTMLFFSAAMVSSASRVARAAMASCLAIICVLKFTPIVRDDLHYPSFVKLAERMPVTIPINPGSSIVWQLVVGSATGVVGGPDPNQQPGLAPQVHDGANAFAILTSERIVCEHATDIAIQVDGEHLSDGLVTLSWSPSEDFSRMESIKRTYESGSVHMQYAFPYPVDGVYVRSVELGDPAVVDVRKASVVCLR